MYLNCEATNPASEFIPPPIRGTSSDKKLKLHPHFFANTIAQHFFKSLGFKIYGVISHQYLDGRSRLMLAISLPAKQPKPVFSHHINSNLAII